MMYKVLRNASVLVTGAAVTVMSIRKSLSFYRCTVLAESLENNDNDDTYNHSSNLDLELKQVQVFFRHGARTPLHVLEGFKQVITQEDRYKADEEMTKELIRFAGYTFLAVVVILFLVACFASDPRSFVIAFGTGSPCCLVCPCIKNLYQYTDPAKLIQASANSYVPGILVEDDGTIRTYEPSPEETETLFEIINEVMSMA